MKHPLLSIFLFAFITGCVSTPTGNIEAFGVATVAVTDKLDTVITRYNEANINDILVEMAGKKDRYSVPSFNPLKKLLVANTDKNKYALYKANKALGLYAKSLTVLAKASSQDDIALAGANLTSALKSMNKQYKILKNTNEDLISDEKSGTLSRVISQISTFYIERKRGKALKEIITTTDPHIQTIGKTINDELLKGVIEGRLYTMKNIEMNALFLEYNKKIYTTTYSQRKKALKKIYSVFIEMQSASATIAQAQKAISSVMKAHSKLNEALKKDRFSSKEIFRAIGDIATVHGDFNDLEELMQDCETEIVADDGKGIICKKN